MSGPIESSSLAELEGLEDYEIPIETGFNEDSDILEESLGESSQEDHEDLIKAINLRKSQAEAERRSKEDEITKLIELRRKSMVQFHTDELDEVEAQAKGGSNPKAQLPRPPADFKEEKGSPPSGETLSITVSSPNRSGFSLAKPNQKKKTLVIEEEESENDSSHLKEGVSFSSDVNTPAYKITVEGSSSRNLDSKTGPKKPIPLTLIRKGVLLLSKPFERRAFKRLVEGVQKLGAFSRVLDFADRLNFLKKQRCLNDFSHFSEKINDMKLAAKMHYSMTKSVAKAKFQTSGSTRSISSSSRSSGVLNSNFLSGLRYLNEWVNSAVRKRRYAGLTSLLRYSSSAKKTALVSNRLSSNSSELIDYLEYVRMKNPKKYEEYQNKIIAQSESQMSSERLQKGILEGDHSGFDKILHGNFLRPEVYQVQSSRDNFVSNDPGKDLSALSDKEYSMISRNSRPQIQSLRDVFGSAKHSELSMIGEPAETPTFIPRKYRFQCIPFESERDLDVGIEKPVANFKKKQVPASSEGRERLQQFAMILTLKLGRKVTQLKKLFFGALTLASLSEIKLQRLRSFLTRIRNKAFKEVFIRAARRIETRRRKLRTAIYSLFASQKAKLSRSLKVLQRPPASLPRGFDSDRAANFQIPVFRDFSSNFSTFQAGGSYIRGMNLDPRPRNEEVPVILTESAKASAASPFAPPASESLDYFYANLEEEYMQKVSSHRSLNISLSRQ